jgi:hypothetical protein
MRSAVHLLPLPVVAALCLVGLPHAAAQEQAAQDDYDKPHDLVLAVDISYSMVRHFPPTLRQGAWLPPSDPEGIRWDAVQFAIDLARPKDRIALVVFRGEPLVLTQFLDPSGFVTIGGDKHYDGKTGRELLKTVVAEIQADEIKTASTNLERVAEARQRNPNFEYEKVSYAYPDLDRVASLRRHTPGNIDGSIWDGTSIVFTLETIKKRLLPRQATDDRQGWVLLFTDGFEASPLLTDPATGRERPATAEEDAPHAYKYADFKYVGELMAARNDPAELDRQVEKRVREFRDKRVPIFTFGLGDDCFMPFLRRISEKSNPPGVRIPGASHHAVNNLVMFEQIRQVAWELRQNWLTPPPRVGTESFDTPRVGIWHDLSLLLFLESLNPRAKRLALAPDGVDVKAVKGKVENPSLAPLTSRSHYFYYLAPDSKVKEQVGIDGALRFVPHRPAGLTGDAQFRYYLGLRTEKPLFEYREPAAGEPRYTPKDLIPFEVAFHPDDRGLFRARDFTVQATLVPAPEAGRAARAYPGRGSPQDPLPLGLVMPAERLFRHERIAGSPGFTLDDNPHGPKNPDLVGPFYVEVLITGTAGPLRGAERRLIRRTIAIKDYPELKITTPQIRLSNAGEDAGRAAVPMELDMVTEPTGHVADLTAEVRPAADADGKSPFPAEALEIAHGEDHAPGGKLELYGRRGVFHIALPAGKWAGLRPGENNTLTFQVRTPWAKAPVTVPITIAKERYRASAPAAVFDFSVKEVSGKKELPVTLHTRLQTEERVFLSAERKWFVDEKTYREAETQTLEFKGDDNQVLQAEVTGLGGKGVLVKGGVAAGAVLPLAVTPKRALSAGRFRRTFYLIGPAVEPAAVTVEVVADQPGIVMAAASGGWLKGDDGRPQCLQEVRLLGLAGTRVQRRFALYLQQTRAVVPSTPAADLLRLGEGEQQRDRLKPDLAPAKEDAVDFALQVPVKVAEGVYSTRLRLKRTDTILGADVPVQFQVVHYGTRTRETGPLHLKFPRRCGGIAEDKTTLFTEAENVPIRWRVVRAPAADLRKEGRPGEVLPDGRLDVEDAAVPGRSLLGERPRDPLTSKADLPLRVLARCDRLAPGAYWGRLLFYAWEDDPRAEEGKPWPLEVEVIVPGRVVQAPPPADGRARVGQEVERLVRVSCYGCEPGQGTWRPVNAEGAASGDALPIIQLVKTEEDARIPGLKHYTYAIKVKPERAGKNPYLVTWEPFCAGNEAEKQNRATVEVNATGVIKLIPTQAPHREKLEKGTGPLKEKGPVPFSSLPVVAFRGEKVTVEAMVDPASLPPGDLQLQAVKPKDAAGQPVTITLQYRQGGLFVGEHQFDEAGEYLVRLAPRDDLNLELEPASVQVAFTLDASSALGTILYGNGSLGRGQVVRVPWAVRLVNKEGAACRWKARLRYPDSAEISRTIFSQTDLASTTSPNYDETRHLQTNLFQDGGEEKAESDWLLSGNLDDDQTLELGIESRLPEVAVNELYERKPRTHPTLGGTNGMVVELQLEWRNGAGELLGQRTVLWPFVVSTADSYLVYYLIAGGVAGLVALALFIRHLILRRRRRRRSIVAHEEGEQDYLREPQQQKAAAAPTKKGASRRGQQPPGGEGGPEEAPPRAPVKPAAPAPSRAEEVRPPNREQGPGPGDDMLPDYLR